jgi:hypothetical protein
MIYSMLTYIVSPQAVTRFGGMRVAKVVVVLEEVDHFLVLVVGMVMKVTRTKVDGLG